MPSTLELWHIIEDARTYIKKLEACATHDKKRSDQALALALAELKNAAAREEQLIQRINDLEKEQSVRDLLVEQKNTQRVNLALMRSLEEICARTKIETENSNALRVQMMKSLERTSSKVVIPPPTPLPTPPLPPHPIECTLHTVQVTVSPTNGLGCAFDEKFQITNFRQGEAGNASALETAGAIVNDQLVSINNLDMMHNWPSRTAIVDFLAQAKSTGATVQMTFTRKRPSNSSPIKKQQQGDSGGGNAGNEQELTPTVPMKLFISTPSGKWR